MSQLPGDAEYSDVRASEPFLLQGRHAALLTFADLRRRQDHEAPVSEVDVMEAESVMAAHMKRLHEILSEAEQMLVYRFFLTAVHRNSSIIDRNAPHVVNNIERQAAMWAEYDALSDELDSMVQELAQERIPLPGLPASLLSADFMWSLVWWIHARRDVLSFADVHSEDPATLGALGRSPSLHDHICLAIYEQAAKAEASYRSFRRGAYDEDSVAVRPQ